MKSDLDSLMQENNLEAILVTGSAQNNPPMVYLTGGAHMTGDLIKKRGAPALLFYNPMEREEARVVQAAPAMRFRQTDAPFASQGVRQHNSMAKQGPDPATPYFRKRYMMPTPLENSDRKVIDAAGLHPSFREHNHSPALEVLPNGDVLLVIYTSYHEYEPGVSLIAARLRFGAEEWDMPSPWVDFSLVNDHAPLLWVDQGVLRLFWGNPRLASVFPFQWVESTDNGATLGRVHFPEFSSPVGPHSKQPINTAFRGKDGTMYVASDAAGATSVLWASRDNGKTWYDTEGPRRP